MKKHCCLLYFTIRSDDREKTISTACNLALSLLLDSLKKTIAFYHFCITVFYQNFLKMTTAATASAIGNAPLAANNLLGEIPMQMTVLALVGLVMVKGAIAFFG